MALRSPDLFSALLMLAGTVALGAPVGRRTFTCAGCHRDQAQSQPHTSMARALLLPAANTVLKSHPRLTFRQEPYSYRIETKGDQSTYSVNDGTGALSVPIRWAFGNGSQTYVLEYQGRLYESLVSYYPAINGLDLTMGDQQIHPKTLPEALGRELSESDSRSCFECHSTASVADGRLYLEALTPGVQCERCHVGANRHLLDISQGKRDSVPLDLRSSTPEDISNFCGQCHRTWERVMRGHWRGEINVRFQPYRLANSKCYDGADRRMSCVACHDPHHEVVREAAAYDAKCLACHTAPAPAHPAAGAKSCPVATSGCSTCHMPKVSLPGGHQVFTDHDIRIVRAGEPYPN